VSKTPEKDVTQVLEDLNQGSEAARAELLRLVYDELRRLASAKMRHERQDHTLQPTALVHEAYMRLLGGQEAKWENRAHFFGAAAEAMRRILVDHARSRQAQKRGGGQRPVPLEQAADMPDQKPEEIIAVDGALSKLAAVDAQKGRVVELRFFGGLGVEETAEVLGISPRTVKRDWAFAKAWLFREINK
jgi:RNA polymerase sigma factor (TIGR02999 family)